MKKFIAFILALAVMLRGAAEESAVQEPENLFAGGTATTDGAFYSSASNDKKSQECYFDNNAGTYATFDLKANATVSGYKTRVNVDYTFSGEPVKANVYSIQAASGALWGTQSRAPKDFLFWGYDKDSETWELLHQKKFTSDWLASELRSFKFINEKAYSAYRLTLNRHAQYIGFAELKLHWIDTSNVLAVESDKDNFGTPSPAYGSKTDMTLDETVTCSIEAEGVYIGSDGEKYVFGGYELYEYADTETPRLIASGTENTVTYKHSVNTKLVWKWEAAPFYVSIDGNDENDGYEPTSAKATLAAAVNAAKIDGQKIIVQDGEYAISSQLSITKNVRIVSANGPEKTIIHGAGTHSLLTLNNSSAIVEGITWTNGYQYIQSSPSTTPPASGITITAGVLKDCTVLKCKSEGYGTAAVAVKGANAAIIGGSIKENSTIYNTKSDYNHKRTWSLVGAGLIITDGLAENVIIADNRGCSAVGVYQTGGIVRNCQILRNIGSSEQTKEAPIMGGTECTAWGTVVIKGGTITGSVIADNIAASAAGAYVFGSGKIENSTIACNRATLDVPFTLSNNDKGVVEQPWKELQPDTPYRRPIGGVILGGANASVTGCTIVSNRADMCGSEQGLYQFAGTAENNTFEANGEDENSSKSTSFVAYVVPDDGQKGEWPYDTREKAARSIQDAVDAVAATRERPGTVYVAAGEYVSSKTMALVVKRPVKVIAEGQVYLKSDGSTTENRLGLWLADTSAVVSGIELKGFYSEGFNDHQQRGYTGWVAACIYDGELTQSLISGSQIKRSYGSAALMIIGGKASSSLIVNNADSESGGALHRGTICVYGGIIEDSRISNNRAMNGAGVFAYGAGARVNRCVISGNYVNHGNATINDYLKNPGAGVYLRAGAIVENTLIVSNVVNGTAVGSGAGVYMDGGKLINCTVADNVNTISGKTSGVQQAGGQIINCIIWRNGNGSEYTEALNFAQSGGTVTTSLTNVDPRFKDSGKDIYRLRQNSSAINAGTTGDWTAEDKDILGNSRVSNRIIDIGAYEYQLSGFRLIVR